MNNNSTYMMKNKNSGFSLIELMVAMVIGIIVLLGLVSLFTNSSILNKSQTGLATLQENGRYAITRLKDDIQQAGRKHCATMAMPTTLITNWDQGYAMTTWTVDQGVDFSSHPSTNGLPLINEIELRALSSTNQLPDGSSITGQAYPLDPRYFIQGHECSASSCTPALGGVGGDNESNLRVIGTSDGDRAAGTDVLTIRYLNGGNRVTAINGNQFTLSRPIIASTNNLAMVADCNTSYVANANWSSNSVVLNGTNVPSSFSLTSDTRAFDMTRDFKTVSYFVGIDNDPNRAGRQISSLYRSENGNVQQLVEGVERFDVFYLAQLQTGRVARLTADEVQTVNNGGGKPISGDNGCILPPLSESVPSGMQLANGSGCLWRSIYAMEIHLLLNTVNDSSMVEDEVFIYSPDGDTAQTPGSTLTNGLSRERMYRREFTATIPIRSYTL